MLPLPPQSVLARVPHPHEMGSARLGGTRWMGLTGIGVLGLLGGQCVTGVGYIAAVVHAFTC